MIEAAEVLGLDVGLKRTGIARASNIARLAEPSMSVATNEAITKLTTYLKDHKVEAIAVGLPRNLKGEDTDQTAWVRQWVDEAKPKINTPLYWQDEALTSREATGKLQNSNIKQQHFDEHALAAAIILQDFLDTPETARVMC